MKILRWVMDLQVTTEVNFSVALIPKPIKVVKTKKGKHESTTKIIKTKGKIADYAIMIRSDEKIGWVGIKALREFMRIMEKDLKEVLKFDARKMLYNKNEWLCFLIDVLDKEVLKKIEAKLSEQK